MSMVSEFKDFAARGNVVDMAVGIIIGGAFGKIVSSFVDGVLMPPVGMLLGGVDFSDLAITLSEKTAEAEAVTLQWGAFVQTAIDFLIIAFAVFMLVRAVNSMRAKEEEDPTPAEPPEDVQLLREIRDSLANR
ncbi:MAG: large-conductance mechanosensitive channel protein MscL [bacterium]|nr:large-conductance mechanosensitive channel protein MscL [bacterium]